MVQYIYRVSMSQCFHQPPSSLPQFSLWAFQLDSVPSVCLSLWLPIYPPTRLTAYPSTRLPIYPSTRLSVYLSTSLPCLSCHLSLVVFFHPLLYTYSLLSLLIFTIGPLSSLRDTLPPPFALQGILAFFCSSSISSSSVPRRLPPPYLYAFFLRTSMPSSSVLLCLLLSYLYASYICLPNSVTCLSILIFSPHHRLTFLSSFLSFDTYWHCWFPDVSI